MQKKNAETRSLRDHRSDVKSSLLNTKGDNNQNSVCKQKKQDHSSTIEAMLSFLNAEGSHEEAEQALVREVGGYKYSRRHH